MGRDAEAAAGAPAAWAPARDFIGYGSRRPDPAWPGGARVAVQIVINYEEGSEYNIGDGDNRTELGLAESPGGRVPAGQRDLAFETMYEFGSRVGFWRLMRLLQERELPATIFGCAVALERNPQAVEAIVASGFDLCCHGYRWEEHFRLSVDDERERIGKAVETIERLTGSRPLGWYCRFGPSENTRRLLVEEGGFLYDSDAYNDELPYWVDVAGKPHLVVPYSLETNDGKYATPAGFSSASDFSDYLTAAFDQLYREGERSPGLMSIGLHPRIAGRPARAHALGRFLDHVQRHDKVWVCRRLDVARHWHRHHPPS
ncbi:MAG: allantoinase PuuE [Lautropia sp.]